MNSLLNKYIFEFIIGSREINILMNNYWPKRNKSINELIISSRVINLLMNQLLIKKK